MFSLHIDDQLSLELIHPNHADELYRLIDEHRLYLARWLRWPTFLNSTDDYLAFVARSLHEYADQQTLVCAMIYKGLPVGTIGFVDFNPTLEKAELGYWLSPTWQGHGIVTRASKALIDVAFTSLGLTKIEAAVATENLPSRAVCERLGMQLEGVIKQGEKLNGAFVDHARYALFKQT